MRCIYCNKPTTNKKYCNNNCQNNYQYLNYINSWKKGKVNGLKGKYQISNHIRRYLLEKYNNKLLEFIKYQNGDITKLPKSTLVYEIKSDKEGYLTNLSSLELSKLSMHLGAGRQTKEDTIDYSAGIIINKTLNDKVSVGDTILTLYTNKELPPIEKEKLFTIDNNINDNYQLVYEIIK